MALSVAICVQAQTTEPDNVLQRINQPGRSVSVSQPQTLDARIVVTDIQQPELGTENSEGDADTAETPVYTPQVSRSVGYRVQVYADNNARIAKTQARQRERAVGQQFPQWGTYVSYASPYWRLRVGDFRADYEAEKAAAEIKKAFPAYAREVRVVRDRIITK